MPSGPETAPDRPEDRSNQTTSAGVSWLSFARCRERFRARWPSVFRMRLVRDQFELLRRPGLSIQSMLDVGATDRVHEANAKSHLPGVEYRSLDIDRTNRHDYHAFSDVDRTFDLVTVFEVIEHLPPKEALELLRQCTQTVRSGGYMLASVPNVFTPGIQNDWTHVAQLHYLDLAGLLAWNGFEIIDGARVYFGNRRLWWTHARLLHALHRLMAVDYAQSIVVLGRKP